MEELSFSGVLRSSGIAGIGLDSEVQQKEAFDRFVLLRQLAEDGGFARTVKCLPAQVTVIAGDVDDHLQPFRAALLGGRDRGKVMMRYGARELHSSEVHVVTSSSHLWASKNIQGVLDVTGVPKLVQLALLELVGLDKFRASSPKELDASALRRLAIVCSFFSKSRMLYYDRPFFNVEPSWVNVLANFMIEGVQVGRHIVLVTGVSKIPASWKGSQYVVVEDSLDMGGMQGDSQRNKNTAAHSFSKLIKSTRAVKEAHSFIVTRPQLIYPQRGTIPEALQAEAITNPNAVRMVLEVGSAHVKDLLTNFPKDKASALSSNTASSYRTTSVRRKTPPGMKRTPSGNLTRVTGRYLISRTPIIIVIRRFFRNLLKRDGCRYSGESLRVALKMAKTKKSHKLQQRLLIGAALLVLALFLNW